MPPTTNKKQTTKATQEFVPIKEVRDGIVVLKDGSMRAILMVSSLNFSLKSQEEQEAITMQFANFLNSLEFSIEISVQSRRLDIRPYIALLESRLKEQNSDLIKIQTREYINFIKDFTENVNIMSKNFFITVPYTPTIINTEETVSSLSAILSGKKQQKTSNDSDFEEARTQIDQRVSIVEQGVSRTGVRTARLGTEEIIELFYKTFNPGESEKPITLNNQ